MLTFKDSNFILLLSILRNRMQGNDFVTRVWSLKKVTETSSFSMGVMYVQILVLVVLLGKVMRKIFFGSLRTAEFEHLMERSWYAVTETCLAFTVFK